MKQDSPPPQQLNLVERSTLTKAFRSWDRIPVCSSGVPQSWLCQSTSLLENLQKGNMFLVQTHLALLKKKTSSGFTKWSMTSINPGVPNGSFSQRCLHMLFLDFLQEPSQGGTYNVMVVSIIFRYNNLQILLSTMGSCLLWDWFIFSELWQIHYRNKTQVCCFAWSHQDTEGRRPSTKIVKIPKTSFFFFIPTKIGNLGELMYMLEDLSIYTHLHTYLGSLTQCYCFIKKLKQRSFMLVFRSEIIFFKQYKCRQKAFFSIVGILLCNSITKSSKFRGY